MARELGNAAFRARTLTRSAWLAAADLLSVGIWHPALWAWRAEQHLVRSWTADASRRFGQSLTAREMGSPRSALTQGGTPWVVLREVASWLGLRRGVRFVDVGAAEGFAAAVLSRVSGASGYAVEPLDRLRVLSQEAFHALGVPVDSVGRLDAVPLVDVSAAYCGWTMFDAPSRARIVERLAQDMPAGARVVTVTHTADHPRFVPLFTKRRLFPWGMADIHVALAR